jgi:sugar lactone lactonase YvrE
MSRSFELEQRQAMNSQKAMDTQDKPSTPRRSHVWIALVVVLGLLILGEIAYQSLKAFKNQGWTTYTPANSRLAHDYVEAVAIDDQGRVWVVTWDGGLSVLAPDGSWKTFPPPTSDKGYYGRRSLVIGEDGRAWIGGDGLRVLEPDGSWTTYTTANSGLADDRVNDVVIDDKGQAWVGTNSGLSVLDINGRWTTDVFTKYGQPIYWVSAVNIDNQRRIWVGTMGDGLRTLDSEGNWTTYTTSNSGITGDSVDKVAIDGQGRVWVGTMDGLSVLDANGNWETYLTYAGWKEGWVWAMAIDDQGRAWVSITDAGLSVLTPDGSRTNYTTVNSGLAGNRVQDIVIDGQGKVWVGTWGGLNVLDIEQDLPFIRPVLPIWPSLRCAFIPVVIVLGVIWLVQRRRARVKKVVVPEPAPQPVLGEELPPLAPAQPASLEPEEMGDVEEF